MLKTPYPIILCIILTISSLNCFSKEINVPNPYPTKDFSSLIGKVKGLNDELLSLHIKLYEGYVKNTNMLLQTLSEMRQEEAGLSFGALKRRLGWEYDGMRLHELYFESLDRSISLSEKSALYQAIIKDFGSYAAWQKDFISTGLMRGIGWVVLYRDPMQKRLLNVWINEHDLGHIAGGTLLLVMDVWEHAYITQYGLDRAQYINAFLGAVNWDVISKRF